MSRKPSDPKLPGTPYGKNIRARLWVSGPQGGYLGVGKVLLLEAIADKGSISQAAKSIGMSYKRAWQLVEELNVLCDTPMVVTETGGAHGGGTRLTERGEQAVHQYRELEKAFALFLETSSQSFEI